MVRKRFEFDFTPWIVAIHGLDQAHDARRNQIVQKDLRRAPPVLMYREDHRAPSTEGTLSNRRLTLWVTLSPWTTPVHYKFWRLVVTVGAFRMGKIVNRSFDYALIVSRLLLFLWCSPGFPQSSTSSPPPAFFVVSGAYNISYPISFDSSSGGGQFQQSSEGQSGSAQATLGVSSASVSAQFSNDMAGVTFVNINLAVYIRGGPNTPFQVQYSYTESAEASDTSPNPYELAGWDSFQQLDVTVGPGEPDGESDSKTVSGGSTVTGTTGATTITYEGTVYSLAWGGNAASEFGGTVGQAEQSWSLSVSAMIVRPNQTPPSAVIVAPPTATVNIPVTLDGSHSYNTDGASIIQHQWTIQNSNGGTDRPSGPTISYTWTAPGTYSVTLTVTDSDGLTGSASTTINVTGGTGTINVTTNLAAATFTITGPATFTGSGTSFTQSNAPPGSYTIAFGVVAGYMTPAPQTLNLAVAGSISFAGTYQAVPPLTLTCPASSGTTNAPYASAFVASGGTGSFISYAIVKGSLPPGLSLTSVGGVTGTPTQTGTFPFVGSVTDSSGATAMSTGCSIVISPAQVTLEICDTGGHCVSSASSTGPDFTVAPNLIANTGTVPCSYIPSASNQLDLVARCVDSTGSNLNCSISITDAGDASFGGHMHSSPQPPAGFSPDMTGLSLTSGSTGSSGLPFLYTPHAVAESVMVTLTGTDPNGNPLPTSNARIDVDVSGLAAMPASSPFYSLVGAMPAHPENHFALPYMNAALVGIAQDFAVAFPGSILSYNDMSLTEGGVFDLDLNWAPPHCGHRSLGGGTNNVDVALVPTASMQKTLRALVKKYGGRVCVVHPTHWHLCF